MKPRCAQALSGIAGVTLALSPALAHAQQFGGGSSINVPIVKLVLGLLLCAFVALIAALALKHFTQGGGFSLPAPGAKLNLGGLMRAPGRRVRILETHRVSPHADICRLSCDDREYLIVVSAGAATVLRETDVPTEAKASP